MPQVGERRSGASETVEWDGKRWNPVQHDASAEKGYHPGLADSEHPWLATMKGFLSGASEAATPGKVGTLAALAIPGALPAAAGAVGATAGLDLLRSHFDTANAPQSGGDYTRDLVESATPAVVGGVANKVMNAIPETALAVGSHIPGKIGMAARAMRAMRGAAPAVEDAAESAAGGFAQQPRAKINWATEAPPARSTEDFWPARETAYSAPSAPAADAPRLAGKAPKLESALDDMLQGLRGEGESAAGDTPAVRSVDRGNLSPYEPPAAPTPSPAREMSDAESFNVGRNTPYGEGAVMPSNVRPAELRSPSLDGLNAPQTGPIHDEGFYGMPTPKGGDVSLLEGGPESGRFPVPGRDGQEIPGASDVEDLIGGLFKNDPGEAPALAGAMPQSVTEPPPSISSLDPLDFYKSRPDAVGEAYRGAKTARLVDPSSVNPLAEKQLGVSLQRTAKDAGLPTRGPGNLDKFLNDWILPQLAAR